MAVQDTLSLSRRYKAVSEQKANGVTRTPELLSDFVAERIAELASLRTWNSSIRIFDPAVGDGILLLSLLKKLAEQGVKQKILVYGFETNRNDLVLAESRISKQFPSAELHLVAGDFLEFVLRGSTLFDQVDLPGIDNCAFYDLIIANPPYVRTQILGAQQATLLAKKFSLKGRVDLYYAFLLGMTQVLGPKGIAGIIISNRFMTTKSGAVVRQGLSGHLNLRHVWDLGDTKLFDAAVLPAVILATGRDAGHSEAVGYTSIYEATGPISKKVRNAIQALSESGIIQTDDGRGFKVQQGTLNRSNLPDAIWRISTDTGDAWLATVESHSWGKFGDVGKIRVGVKTCADEVFIRNDWHRMPERERPELLRPLTTHHTARRYRAAEIGERYEILYPHEMVQGRRRAVDLSAYPRTAAYLEKHRTTLEGRRYLIEGQRKWYEIWVPQNPSVWRVPKLVFRDIVKEPTFWIDQDGTIVNGDCYWLVCNNPEQSDLLWLALAVGNSTFIETFYDHRFHNKLYAGRRRFMTQYVEQFPLPNPDSAIAKAIVANTKELYYALDTASTKQLVAELDAFVWQVFGLSVKEVSG